MKYQATVLKDEIVINNLVTIHYFEFGKDYSFPGEKHDIWEILYVDHGELSCKRENEEVTLKHGDIIFHKPNEWHSVHSNGIGASAAVIISFKCLSPSMRYFENKIFHTGSLQRNLLSQILQEAQNAFDTPLDALFTPKLHRKKNALFGSEQLIKLYLCQLLLTLLRNDSAPPSSSIKKNLDSGLLGEIIEFMNSNISTKLSLDDISKYAGISKTALKQLFREQAGCGACEYFIRMKIDLAKTYIREQSYNFTQIAEMLGYESIHYFSRQFKKYVNMSPSEYASSIKALSEKAVSFTEKDI